MERTVRPIQLVVPAMHSVGQDAERRKLRRRVDSVGQSGHLVVAHCLGSHGRDFLASRTLAEELMLVVGMGLDASCMDSQTHHERLHHERDSSKDLVAVIAMDHQRECGWERSERGSCLFESERSPSETASVLQGYLNGDEVVPQWPVVHSCLLYTSDAADE